MLGRSGERHSPDWLKMKNSVCDCKAGSGGSVLMPSLKKLKDTMSVYCGTRSATTNDHVFARKFFLEARRGHLPQVPACRP